MSVGTGAQPAGYDVQSCIMPRTKHEVADIIKRFGGEFADRYHPNTYQLHVLDTLTKCRTSALGGHVLRCDCCREEQVSYNSCRNRHCPKCQCSQQAFWAEDRMDMVLDTRHYHIVFTVPEVLNKICISDSKSFYDLMFSTTWETLKTFGYSHYGVESGAISVLHTWGQNLMLHPHIHCIVPAAGLNLKGNLEHIGKKGKYLYPVHMLSATFRGKLLQKIKKRLTKEGTLQKYRPQIESAYKKDWVVFCSSSFGKPKHVVGYLARYIHRIAISNHRILNVNNQKVTFRLKDYENGGKSKVLTLDGVEFLRRFCLHILPHRFVKIRYYGIYSSRYRAMVQQTSEKLIIKIPETTNERLKRLTGFDMGLCPVCRKGHLEQVEAVPRIRSPSCFGNYKRATNKNS